MTTETRQVFVELLLLAPYLDKHLSMVEDEALERALTAIGWSPTRPGDACLPTAFALVREAAANELKIDEFMRERTAIIRSAGESSLAFEWLGRILGSDGMSGTESYFLQRAESLLFS
ncbi:MAG: hypothetical protein K9N23_09165 [Akkermansiaceae bacterium]|nr:hypothetical protein [Akkermansiaceae bacterium]MCF7731846.1 hypothetical protein [Akkermansiaceae bacterium]